MSIDPSKVEESQRRRPTKTARAPDDDDDEDDDIQQPPPPKRRRRGLPLAEQVTQLRQALADTQRQMREQKVFILEHQLESVLQQPTGSSAAAALIEALGRDLTAARAELSAADDDVIDADAPTAAAALASRRQSDDEH